MVGISNKEAPVRLLALDGGGVRGLSELLILQQLMLYIQHQNRLQSTPKPCEVFDMIGGTSTGGLIAIMLGRLQMSAEQVIEEYAGLSKDVFGERRLLCSDGRYKASNLENAIRGIIHRYGKQNSDAKLFAPENKCKVFVVAKNDQEISGSAQLFRSYVSGAPGEYLDVSICEAARATSAASTYFKPQKVISKGKAGEFVDGGMGANNPAKLLLAETQRVFSPSRCVSCIVSIGTGKKSISDVKPPGFFQRILPSSLGLNAIPTIVDMATDCEKVADELDRKFYHEPDLYYRFNVDEGLGQIGMDNYKKLGHIKAWTIQYLKGFRVEERAKQASFFLHDDASVNGSVARLKV